MESEAQSQMFHKEKKHSREVKIFYIDYNKI